MLCLTSGGWGELKGDHHGDGQYPAPFLYPCSYLKEVETPVVVYKVVRDIDHHDFQINFEMINPLGYVKYPRKPRYPSPHLKAPQH